MKDLGTLYAITVRAETIVDFSGVPADFHADDVAEFNRDRHRHVMVELAKADQRYEPAEVLAAHVWAAGVIGRLALEVGSTVRSSAAKRNHACLRGEQSFHQCGDYYEDYVSYPCAGSPTLQMSVPTPEVDAWVQRFEQSLGEMLVADQTEAARASGLRPAPEEEHAGVLLADASTTVKEERIR